MKISLHWLRDWVDPGSDVPHLAHALTMAGLEIEAVHRAGPDLPGVIVAEVRGVEPHPDAEKLKVCRVWTGREELQIVCGASNVRVGMKAPLATLGSQLPGGMEIKKAKLRGVESFGMLCSAKELTLAEESSGLYDLPQDLKTGVPLVEALSLADTILEVNLTPNRGDCMSVLGVAREVAAIRKQPLTGPRMVAVPAAIAETFPVRIDAADGCPTFVGRVIRGIRAQAQTPFWMQDRLRRAGLRPISAVVDVTNYVMLELGQPMHAYDLNKLHGAVVVRLAKPAEQLKLLDGRIVTLGQDVLVIADERGALGIAGVMGGEESGIAPDTCDVFLEVAYFEPNTIAGRGRRYGLITDASQRFERGVDPKLQERAIERATELLLACAGGQAGPVVVTRGSRPSASEQKIVLRHERVQRVLGANISARDVITCLERIGIELEPVNPSTGASQWAARVPSWRFDLRIEEDLIEEVARLVGFDNIPERRETATQTIEPWTETRIRAQRAADLLVDRGYQEAITYAFTDAAAQQALCGEAGLALANPISSELGAMRVSLWPGLLRAVSENQRRQQARVRLFEIGRKYASQSGAETEVVAGVVTGTALPEQWGIETSRADFFDVKADVEALLGLTGAADEFRFERDTHPALHPGQSARIWRGNQAVGWLGVLHPQQVRRLDLTYPAVLFEIETETGLGARVPTYHEISKFPAIRRDIAVIVEEALPADVLRTHVQGAAGSALKDLTVLSVYRGRQIQDGKKSIALSLVLQDTSRTLTDDEADAIVAQVVERLRQRLDAAIRDQ